jgi:GNAT superfamily N-acetyltransferase
VQAWQAAYAGLMPAAYLAAMDEEERAQAWEARVAGEQTAFTRFDHETMIAEAGESPPLEIVGIATVGPDRDDPAASVGELWMINVLPAAWGTGVGPQLLASASNRLVELGFTEAVLWVVKGNARARRFYEREGWVPDGGEKRQVFGDRLVREVRYTTTLIGARRPAGQGSR